MKIALFKSTGGLVSGYDPDFGQAMVDSCGYTRVSEDLEVDFPMLPTAVVVEGQLKQVETVEKELRNKFQQKLNEIAEARAKLLSLTHETAACEICQGRKFRTVRCLDGSDADDQPCPDCNPNGDSRDAP